MQMAGSHGRGAVPPLSGPGGIGLESLSSCESNLKGPVGCLTCTLRRSAHAHALHFPSQHVHVHVLHLRSPKQRDMHDTYVLYYETVYSNWPSHQAGGTSTSRLPNSHWIPITGTNQRNSQLCLTEPTN